MATTLRVIGNLIGSLMFWIGIVWSLQGLGFLPGALMHGDLKWTFIGTPMSLVGLAIVVLLTRRKV
jgi:hypothetical protein